MPSVEGMIMFVFGVRGLCYYSDEAIIIIIIIIISIADRKSSLLLLLCLLVWLWRFIYICILYILILGHQNISLRLFCLFFSYNRISGKLTATIVNLINSSERDN